ncbi:MAG: thioredoxin TrxC [Thiotrichaceae bacterium]|uniref:Thioredoxin n=1 Tax=Candidatus Thiocaldithrix dubininis TaxID=3080823 RepID=A0AA95H9S3_9GAMM|nr:MAG: thioredoxin TrxC [Candidatus Thiocaldithrix dubininis]
MSDALNIVCPHCNATNRIPAERLSDKPKCGKCHQPLFDGHPVELTGETFSKMIARTDIPVVVDFWAPWCGPCKMMAPAFQQAAQQLQPNVRLAKVNTEDHQMIGARYQIRSIPTMVIFKNGQEVARQSGAMSVNDIVRWVRSNS